MELKTGVAQLIEEYAITMAYPDTARPDVAGRYADAILDMVRHRMLIDETVEAAVFAHMARESYIGVDDAKRSWEAMGEGETQPEQEWHPSRQQYRESMRSAMLAALNVALGAETL